jgi:hypothetical protein
MSHRLLVAVLASATFACSSDTGSPGADGGPTPCPPGQEDTCLGEPGQGEDGEGEELGEPVVCDHEMAIDDPEPASAARALGLCGDALVSARYVRTNGAPSESSRQVGILPTFGANVEPREGERLLVLSSGSARCPGDPDECGSNTCGGYGPGKAPAGFPQETPGCELTSKVRDDMALEIRVRAPADAVGFSLDYNFFSFEYPEYVCSFYNDQFIATVSPAPAGSINGNIAFDEAGAPVSVNFSPYSVCSGCSAGTAELAGTGFDTWGSAGATGWLRSQAPVTPGAEITIYLAIWDSGDHSLDSTVVIDNFQWMTGAPPVVATAPVL